MCFGREKYAPGEWFWARAAQSSVVAFEKYDPRTDYRSDTKIDKQCCFDEKRVVHPFWLQAEAVWWCRQCMVCIVLDIDDYIDETEFNGESSRLHQLNKNCTRKRRHSKLAIMQSISADFNSFCEWNISKKAIDVIGAKKDRWRKVKSFGFVSKSKGIGNTVGRMK